MKPERVLNLSPEKKKEFQFEGRPIRFRHQHNNRIMLCLLVTNIIINVSFWVTFIDSELETFN